MREVYYYDLYYRGVVQGEAKEAARLLREREQVVTPFMRGIFAATRALLEGDEVGCLENAEAMIGDFPDPEAVFLMVRHIGYFGHAARVVEVLERVLDGGYNWFRTVRAPDPWLEKLFDLPEFLALEKRAEAEYVRARREFYAAGGGSLLGVDLPESAIPTGRP